MNTTRHKIDGGTNPKILPKHVENDQNEQNVANKLKQKLEKELRLSGGLSLLNIDRRET